MRRDCYSLCSCMRLSSILDVWLCEAGWLLRVRGCGRLASIASTCLGSALPSGGCYGLAVGFSLLCLMLGPACISLFAIALVCFNQYRTCLSARVLVPPGPGWRSCCFSLWCFLSLVSGGVAAVTWVCCVARYRLCLLLVVLLGVRPPTCS